MPTRPRTVLLVDRVAEVDRRGQEAAEEGADARAEAVDDHHLAHVVGVAGDLAHLPVLERLDHARNGDRDQEPARGDAVTNCSKAHGARVRDAGRAPDELINVLPAREPQADRELVLPEAVDGVVDVLAVVRVRAAPAGVVDRERLLAVLVEAAVLVVVAQVRPVEDRAHGDDDDRRRHAEAADAERPGLGPVEADHGHEEGRHAHERLRDDALEEGRHRQPDEADGGDGRQQRGERHVADEERPEPGAGDLDEADEETGSRRALPNVVGHLVRAQGRPAGLRVLVVLLEHVNLDELEDHVERHQQPGRRVDAVGVRGHVRALVVTRELARHPRVPQVAEEEREADAREHLAVCAGK